MRGQKPWRGRKVAINGVTTINCSIPVHTLYEVALNDMKDGRECPPTTPSTSLSPLASTVSAESRSTQAGPLAEPEGGGSCGARSSE